MLTRVKIISWGEEKKLVRSTLSSHKKNIRDFIKTAETRIRKANGYRGLLQTYATEWQELSKQCIELITFFLDMEQGHRQEQFMLYEWRKAILSPVQDQILDGVFRLVNAERDGESIDSTHVIAVRETFVTYSSDMDKKKFYRHHFETGYIAAAVSFYEFRAKEYLAIAGPRLYMKYAAINLKKEDEKARKYLPTENYGDESVKAFMQSLAEVLVTDHKDVILAECSDLIKVNNIEHLQIMLNLMERIYDGKRMMTDILEKTIIDVAKAELEASDADGGTCLEDLITIFKRFDYLVEDAFHCDPRFLLARDQAYRFIVNDSQKGEVALQSTSSGMDGSIPQKWDFHERLANLVRNCAVSDIKSDDLEDRLKDAVSKVK